MKLFQLGQTQVKLHPGLLVVFIVAAILGMLSEIFQAILALTLHEVFHAIVAHAMGYRVDTVEFMPYGGVARLIGQSMSNKADFFIALAGPLCNLIVAGGVMLAVSFFPAAAGPLRYFLLINLSLACFNLLPALPLDGGRMFRAILANFLRHRTATLITGWLGVTMGAALVGFSVYLYTRDMVNLFLLVMGVFLILGAARELRSLPQAQIAAMLRRRDAFARGEAVPMRQVAVRESMSAGAALRQLSSSRYNLLQVLDEELNIIGQLDEGKLLAGIAARGQDVTVGALVRR